MEDPTNSVVDSLAAREGLVATLMCNNPETGCRETHAEAVECPQAPLRETVESRVGEVEVLGGDVRVKFVKSVDEARNDHDVLEDVQA